MTETIQSKSSRRPIIFACLLILLFVSIFIGAGVGNTEINPIKVVGIMLDEFNTLDGVNITHSIDYSILERSILLTRLPRIALGILVGALLAVAGTAIQAVFRSPLADPSLIGISSGSALSVTIFSAFGITTFLGDFTLPMTAFIGGVLVTVLIYRLATKHGRTDVMTMLLAGIAVNALAGAGTGLLAFITGDNITGSQDVLFWSLGGLDRANWDKVLVLIPIALISLGVFYYYARALNAFLLGESEAGHLGINVQFVKQLMIVLVAISVGAGVAMAGIIAFVALVIPQVLRMLLGPDHRWLIPSSALLGGSSLLLADVLSRTVAYPAPLPIGLITSLIGGPFFLWLLLRGRAI